MFSQSEIERILEVFIYQANLLPISPTDDKKYFDYIGKMKKVNLFFISDQDIDIIRDFLFKWGHMGRTGVKGAMPNMRPIIQQYAQFLQRAQKQNLHTSNLPPDKQTIQDLFEALCSLVGPVSAAKTLHLICPGFFPLWDTSIIIGYDSSYKAKHGSPLIIQAKQSQKATGQGYYTFMEFTKSFIGKYYQKLSQIQQALKAAKPPKDKSLVKLVDEFNMFAAHAPYYYLV